MTTTGNPPYFRREPVLLTGATSLNAGVSVVQNAFWETETGMKAEHPPLFAPGFHDINEADIPRFFVEPFNEKDRREKLAAGLAQLLEKLKELALKFEVWLDGSFATEKPEPEDIDVAVFFDINAVNALDDDGKRALEVLSIQVDTKVRYNCHIYFIPNHDPNIRSYWRGWFGFARGEVPKGIPRMFV